MIFEFHVPWPPKELSPNGRYHWAVKSKAGKIYKRSCYYLAMSALDASFRDLYKESTKKISMRIEFHPPDHRHRDDDNCIASFKYGRDGIADALGVDDRLFSIVPVMAEPDIDGGDIKIIMGIPDE